MQPARSRRRRRRERRFLRRRGNRESNPHPSGTVARNSAEDQKGTGLPGYESDIGTLTAGKPLLQLTRGGSVECWWHRASGQGVRVGDNLDRVRQILVLVLEVEYDRPAAWHGEIEFALTESIEVHAAVETGQTRHNGEVHALGGRVRAQPGRIDVLSVGDARGEQRRAKEQACKTSHERRSSVEPR